MNSSNKLFIAIGISAVLTAATARAQVVDVTAPGNPIVGVAATLGSPTSTLASVGTLAGINNYPAGEPPPAAIDNITVAGNKYLNFLETGAGFIVTPSALSALNGLRFFTGNDAPERDPLTVTIEGTNSPNATTTLNSVWTTVYSGASGLATDPGRDAFGVSVSFPDAPFFSSYRMLVSSVRNAAAANSFQFGEIELLGTPIPEPTSLILAGLAVGPVVYRFRKRSTIATE